jgi:hypothetical protein
MSDPAISFGPGTDAVGLPVVEVDTASHDQRHSPSGLRHRLSNHPAKRVSCMGQTRKSSLHSITLSARPVAAHAPRSDHPARTYQEGFAGFRKTISLARSTKARRLAAMWRRPG